MPERRIHEEETSGDGPTSSRFGVLCDRGERALRETSIAELPEAVYLDRAADELFRVAQAAAGVAPPDGAPTGWVISARGAAVSAAMALRTGRAIALLVRSGYGFEAAGLVRRLGEITQHAAGCAHDPTGAYPRNWGARDGKAGKPSAAYMRGVSDPQGVREKWGVLSNMEHANAAPYLEFLAAFDERGAIVHPVAPARHGAADALALHSAAWDLVRTAAAVCKVHGLKDGPTLALAEELKKQAAANDERMNEWAANRQREKVEADRRAMPRSADAGS